MSTSTRFELPALNLNFGSITEGTNIPPPPESPVEKAEKTKKEPAVTKTDEVKAVQKPAEASAVANGNLAGTKRPAEEAPPSPSASHRAGSLRRMFSRTRMNNDSIEGQSVANGIAPSINGSRPASRSGGSILDERMSKRASGWFRRLRGGEPKRSSLMFEPQSPSAPSIPETPTTSKPTGPPPPMIPELKELEKDEGSLGNDLFKNIK